MKLRLLKHFFMILIAVILLSALSGVVYAGVQDPDLLGIRLLGLDKAAECLSEAKGTVKVAVIDSGVDKTHSWFEGRINSELSKNFAEDKSADDYSDVSGHGTHVAGIIAKGTPSQVEIVAIRILQKDQNGEDVASVYTLMDAINYAVDSGCDVINMSLGYDTAQLKQDLGGSFDKMDAVLKNAAEKGSIMIVAAGNSKEEISNNYLAYSPYTICVGGLEDDMYSGAFRPLDGENYGDGMEFVAPGYYIESAAPGNKTVSKTGTSMACPHIACAAAILKLEHPEHNLATVRETLCSYAVDMEEKGWDSLTGYGYPDLSTYDGSEFGSEKPENGSHTDPSQGKNENGAEKEKTGVKKPGQVVLKKLKAGRGTILAVWKKQKNIQGYQLRYKRKGQKKYKTITIKNASVTKKYLKKLKRKKPYYVQIRSFRKSGKTVKYGKWSRRLMVRVK